jgi:short-subunit dehydrogenase
MIWKDRVAITTGASSGIGLAVARKLVAKGARVALVARTEDKLEAIARELNAGDGGERAAAFPLDVKDRAGAEALPGRVVARFGRLDFLVNNAGANHRGAVEERSAGELADIIETNLLAPILLTRAALAHVPRGGVIVNVASLAGKVPVPHEATYSASKAGLRAFTRALDVELEERAIRCCSVNPGPVDTGFFGAIEAVPNLVFSQPMSSADDVADAVIEAIEGDALEVDVPAISGKLATLGYLSPKLFGALRPVFEKRGAAAKAKFIAKKRSS